ncbi:MAG TPA: hypothetical protein DC049_08755, partial [Spirochaetia bacterium]|nr:hypothetical protein [Spirochaetia bacterium]
EKHGYIGFQIGQHYGKQDDSRLTTISWSAKTRFTDIFNFGILVLNNKPFGAGNISIREIIKTESGDKAHFTCTAKFKNIIVGSYTLKTRLVLPDFSIEDKRQELEITGAAENYSLQFDSIKNRNGVYTVYIAVGNRNNDQLVYAGNFINEVASADLFGKPVFCPEVKQIKWTEGAFFARQAAELWIDAGATVRTKKTARIFREDYAGYTGITLNARQSEKEPETGIIMRLSDKITFNGTNILLKKQGYHLLITRTKTIISAADEPGLFFGTRTFFDLLLMNMKYEKGFPVPCTEIADYPDAEIRPVFSYSGGQVTVSGRWKDAITLKHHLDWIDRVLVGNKANVYLIALGSLVQYKRKPEFNNDSKYLTLADLRILAEYCRDRFISIGPVFNIGGHASHWLLPWHPELREKGWKQQANVALPEHDKIVYDCFLDVIEAMQPEYFSPAGDEWWHSYQSGETADDLLEGKPRSQIFLEWHTALNDWLRKKNIRLVMFSDMLNPNHNGMRFDLYKIADKMPRDIIFLHWTQYDKVGRFFADKGFEEWGVYNGVPIYGGNASASQYKGQGKITYSWGNQWKFYSESELTSMLTCFRSLDYAWSFRAGKQGTFDDLAESGWVDAVSSLRSVQKNPAAGYSVTPIDLKPFLRDSFGMVLQKLHPAAYSKAALPAELQSGQVEIGNVKMILETKNNCLALSQNGAGPEMTVNNRYSSLVFLHTAVVKQEELALNRTLAWRDWSFGTPAGQYRVKYNDGTEVIIPLRTGRNINIFDAPVKFKSVYMVRRVEPVMDIHNNERYLYQFEWINPKPEVLISSVVLEISENPDNVMTVLFAVSGRDTWQVQ